MQLIWREETVRVVNVRDLDKFLSQVFGLKYETVAMEEWNNSECHLYEITSEPLSKYEQEELNKGWPKFMTGALLNEACHRGLIEPGEYLIEISW